MPSCFGIVMSLFIIIIIILSLVIIILSLSLLLLFSLLLLSSSSKHIWGPLFTKWFFSLHQVKMKIQKVYIYY